MIVIFARNDSWISRLIRLMTRSHWSHVAILDRDDLHVIEARGGHGVEINHLLCFQSRYKTIEYRYIPGEPDKAKQHIGKPFDNDGIKGILFRSFKHCPNSWFCSELVAHAAHAIPDANAHKHTPESLYNISTKLP
jgi:hypothetical protein